MGERMSYAEQYIESRRVDQHGEFDLTDAIETLEAADAEIAALRESLRAILYQYTFCVDTDPEDADIAKARALLGEGGGS
jgi:hypothetical protein